MKRMEESYIEKGCSSKTRKTVTIYRYYLLSTKTVLGDKPFSRDKILVWRREFRAILPKSVVFLGTSPPTTQVIAIHRVLIVTHRPAVSRLLRPGTMRHCWFVQFFSVIVSLDRRLKFPCRARAPVTESHTRLCVLRAPTFMMYWRWRSFKCPRNTHPIQARTDGHGNRLFSPKKVSSPNRPIGC